MKLAVIFLLFTVYSCSSSRPAGKTAAEVLFQEAQELVKDERYILATEKLNVLKSQYPYSFFAPKAELLLADVQFLQEKYVESAASYLVYKDLHPRSKVMEYVIFKIAESYFMQIPDTFDRDLSAAELSISYFKNYLVSYPTGDYVAKAKEKISEASKMILNKEFYIADFYYRTEKYEAARFWYNDIISKYEDSAIQARAMSKKILSLYKLELYQECLSSIRKGLNHLKEQSFIDQANDLLPQCQKGLKDAQEESQTVKS